MKRLIASLFIVLLAACHDRRPPAPTPEQNQQLDEAENMLNDLAANEEEPADRSASPSNRTNR